MSYEYLVVEFLVDEQHPDERLGRYPDMERIYFPAWLNHKTVENAVDRAGGGICGPPGTEVCSASLPIGLLLFVPVPAFRRKAI